MSLFIEHLRKKVVEKHENAIVIVTGKPGSGKSLSSITMAMNIYPQFDVRRDLCLEPHHFINKLEWLSKTRIRPYALIWDEVGVGLPARDAMAIQNKLLGVILQIMRYLNFALFLTTPHIDFIDINLRRVAHYKIHILGNNGKRAVGILREIVNSPVDERTYMRIPVIDGVKVDRVEIAFPPKEVIDIYNEISEKWKTRKIQEVKEALEELKEEENNVSVHYSDDI
ncbi:MAG: hypothetical protein ACTSR2_01160 [Candidatus Hodarchaeales archaeon]